MAKSKIHGFQARTPTLDTSFVRNRNAWDKLKEKPQGENIQYDIKVHKGKIDAFLNDVNNRIKNEVLEEKAEVWLLIHEALGNLISPSRLAVSARKPYRYKRQ